MSRVPSEESSRERQHSLLKGLYAMDYHCNDCGMDIPDYLSWAIHLVSPGHQSNVEMKVDEWVEEKNPNCLVLIANSLQLEYSVCQVVGSLLLHGHIYNLCIYLLEDDRSLYVVEYESSRRAAYALCKLGECKSWSVQRLTDVRPADWSMLLPEHTFGKRQLTEMNDAKPQTHRTMGAKMKPMSPMPVPCPPEKVPRLENSCFLSSKDCATKKVLPDLTVAESSRMALREELLNKTMNFLKVAAAAEPPSVEQTQTALASPRSPGNPPRSTRTDESTKAVPVSLPNSRFYLDRSGGAANPETKENELRAAREKTQAINTRKVASKNKSARVHDLVSPRLSHATAAFTSDDNSETSSPSASSKTSNQQAECFTSLSSGTEKEKLDKEIDSFYKKNALPLDDLQNIKDVVVRDLEKILKEKYPQCKLDMFDTILLDEEKMVEIHVRDLGEINYRGVENDKRKKHAVEGQKSAILTRKMHQLICDKMEKLANTNPEKEFIKELGMKLDGFMSHVEFTHTTSSSYKMLLACCISRPQITRWQDFKLIEFYMKLNPRIRQLLCYILHWADCNGLIGFSRIKDYFMSLLVIMLLTKKRVIPSLSSIQFFCQKYIDTKKPGWLIKFCDNENLSNRIAAKIRAEFIYRRNANFSILDTIREFFLMYGGPKMSERVIATWTCQFVPPNAFHHYMQEYEKTLEQYFREVRTTGKRFRPLHGGETISMQDPFELTFNLGSTIPSPIFKKFQRKCMEGVELVERLIKKQLEPQSNDSCTFKDLFRPGPLRSTTASERQASPTERLPKPNANSVYDNMRSRFNAKLDSNDVRLTPNPYVYFKMDSTFYDAFVAHMRRVDSNAVPSQLKLQSCRLWSTFAVHFIRQFWELCFGMDAIENTLIQKLIGREECHGRYEVLERDRDRAFPVGYNLYYSVLNCKGYFGQTPSTRMKMKQHKVLSALQFEHPFDLEWEVTKFSKSMKQNREAGKVTWKLDCEVMYEDLPSPSSVRNPIIMFVLHGLDADILKYIQDAILETFPAYMVHLLKLWFEKKKGFEHAMNEGIKRRTLAKTAKTANSTVDVVGAGQVETETSSSISSAFLARRERDVSTTGTPTTSRQMNQQEQQSPSTQSSTATPFPHSSSSGTELYSPWADYDSDSSIYSTCRSCSNSPSHSHPRR